MKPLLVISLLSLSISILAYQWPLSQSSNMQDTMTSAFGVRQLSNEFDFHRGIDLQAAQDTPVYPCHLGVAYRHLNTGSSGFWIEIRGTGMSSIYAHLNSFSVAHEEEITEWDTEIGLSGITAGPDPPVAPHLHLGISDESPWDRDNAIHPLNLLNYDDATNPTAHLEDGHNYHDFTTEIIVAADELDIESFRLDFDTEQYPGQWESDTTYDINYETGENFPQEQEIGVHGIVSPLESNDEPYADHWNLEIWADDFSPDGSQHVHFRIYRYNIELDIRCVRFTIEFFQASGESHTTGFLRPDDPSGNDEDQILPIADLFPNYPNPFNPQTTISYQIYDTEKKYQLKISNIKGQLIRNYFIETKPGKGCLVWDGRNSNNKPVSSGIYLYRLEADKEILNTRKMTLVK